ncbi:MAG: hypothetical protein KAY22_05705 [Rhizorhabdus sp.]|uniref:hypothetical protein n=1 Tax=Rhizorhabdus sp. TaxID=1968843 RepID=UPI001B539E5E|nr:hypothetical protein [Rhizorhabdus sp.]MBP8231781.1 hypothetical protein [Rhizorhabdus sp.]
MDWSPYDLLDKAWVALVGVIAWMGKRHFDDDRALADRLAKVEAEHATRTDIVRVESRLTELQQTVAENHKEILHTLLRQ